MKHDVLIHIKQEIIYQFVHDHPGLYINKLSRDLNIPKSTLKYHLDCLEKRNLILSSKSKRYLRYYVVENNSIKYKKFLDVLRLKTNRYILLTIMGQITASRKELIELLELHPSTVDKAIMKLIELNLIEKAPKKDGNIYIANNTVIIQPSKGREIFYRISPTIIEDLFNTFIIYHEMLFIDKKIGDIVKNWYGLKDGSRVIPTKMNGRKKTIDKAIEILFDVFPNPYFIR